LQKIREAKAALEDEAREKAEHERAEAEKKLAEREEEEKLTGKRKRGRKPEPPDPDKARPADKAQRNFTDPESRIMPDGAIRQRRQPAGRLRVRLHGNRCTIN
jgi:hypothetical protein